MILGNMLKALGSNVIYIKTTYVFISIAEKALEFGAGGIKYAMVVETDHILSFVLSMLITKKERDKMIELQLSMKKYLQKEIDLLEYENDYKHMYVFKVE